MIRNGFGAVCEACHEPKTGCAKCIVNGTNCYGDREARLLTLCGPCRRDCRGRCRLMPQHQPRTRASTEAQ